MPWPAYPVGPPLLGGVTSFLFLTLVGLALESQDHSRRLGLPLGFTFFICVVATCFMLVGVVPWPIQFNNNDDEQRKEKCGKLCTSFYCMCLALTILLTVLVPMLTKPCVEWAVGMVILPWISIGAVFVVCKVQEIEVGNRKEGNHPGGNHQEGNSAVNNKVEGSATVNTISGEGSNQPSTNDLQSSNKPSNNDLEGGNELSAVNDERGGNPQLVVTDNEGNQQGDIQPGDESVVDRSTFNGDIQPAGNEQQSAGNNKEGSDKPTASGDSNDNKVDNKSAGSEEAKPASLGLTKAIFAGFLAVMIPNLSSSNVSGATKVFIVITAAIVISGLIWRLLTHLAPTRAAVVAADAACLITHIFVMGAAIAFVLMANDALTEGNTTCQIPCNNSSRPTPDLILNCFMNMTIFHPERRGFVLSSVEC